jgi:serine/threonine protein kinase
MSEQSPQPSGAASHDIETMLLQVVTGHDALPAGTRLGRYVVDDVLGRTDIAVVYRAHDPVSSTSLEIEEYLPEAVARREDDGVVRPRAAELADAFEAGHRAFIEEARHLTQPLHPALLQVLDSWQDRGTAYRSLPALRETTLDGLRADLREPPSADWLRALLLPLAGALQALHAQSLVHGNVRPGNVVIRADGTPLLLGFDAARWALGALTPHPEPAFLAIEQADQQQSAWPIGAWTDVYALSALALFALTGHAPVPATQRLGSIAQPVSEALARMRGAAATPWLDEGLAQALEQAFALVPAQRLSSIAELQAALGDAAPAASLLSSAPLEPPRAERPIRFQDAPRVAMAKDARAPGPSLANAIRIDLQVDPDEARAAAAAAADDDAWRAVRPGSAPASVVPSARGDEGGARRGWWLAAVVPVIGIALLAWHWDRVREIDRMLTALGHSVMAEWSPQATHGADPAPPPAATTAQPPAPPAVQPSQTRTAQTTTLPPTPVARNVPPARAAAEALLDRGLPPPAAGPADAPPQPQTTVPAAPAHSPAAAVPPAAQPPVAAPAPQPAQPQPRTAPQRAESEVGQAHAAGPRAPDAQLAETRRRTLPEPEAENPREACSPRTNFSLYRCMQQQCERDRFYAHAQCVRLRLRDEVSWLE